MMESLQREKPWSRGLALAVGLACASLPSAAQSILPATAQTTLSNPPSATVSSQPTVSPQGTEIRWDGRLLAIHAHGESLQQVLDQVAARAGLRIRGALPSDRIFGSYGPAPLADVLASLLSGLRVNMLFVERTASRQAELTVTAREGDASPPSLPAPSGNSQVPQPVAAQNQAEPASASPQPVTPESVSAAGAARSDVPAAGAIGNPPSPNGVKTPQEIFEQLKRMRASPASR